MKLQEIPVGKLKPSPFQRRRFESSNDGLSELAASIAEHGVLEPVVVRPGAKTSWELVCGERRLRACKMAKCKTIPCIIRRDLDDEAAAVLCLAENVQRESLHPLEEAESIELLLGFDRFDGFEAVAAELGIPVARVARRQRLCTLTESWRDAIALQGKHAATAEKTGLDTIPVGGLEHVARLAPDGQEELLAEILGIKGRRWSKDVGGYTVSLWAKMVGERMHKLSSAPWKHRDAVLVPTAGACSDCPHRSTVVPLLFGAPEKGLGRCLSPACWSDKIDAHYALAHAAMTEEYGEQGFLIIGDGAGEVREHQVEISERCKRGYTPALICRAWHQTKGRRVWARKYSSYNSSGSNTTSRKKTLKQREQLLERKRLRWAITEGADRVRASKRVPSTDRLFAMALHGGTKTSWDRWSTSPFKGLVEAVGAGAETRKKLWRLQLWPVLRERLLSCEESHHDHKYARARFDELQTIASWVGVQVEHLIGEAAEKFLEPKSWAAERAASKRKKNAA